MRDCGGETEMKAGVRMDRENSEKFERFFREETSQVYVLNQTWWEWVYTRVAEPIIFLYTGQDRTPYLNRAKFELAQAIVE